MIPKKEEQRSNRAVDKSIEASKGKHAAGKKREPVRSIKKRRWATVIASVLALAMVFSAGYFFFIAMESRKQAGQGMDIEAYVEYLEQEIDNLEQSLAKHGPQETVLLTLLNHYNNLAGLKMLLQQDEDQSITGYLERMIGICDSLIELAPDNLEHYLSRLYLYLQLDEKEVAREKAAELSALLRDNPNPAYTMQLIKIYRDSLKDEEAAEEEIAWLDDYFKQAMGEEEPDNETRYYYAVYLNDYKEDKKAALEQLELILETEPEDSALYKQAESLRDRLQSEEQEKEDDADKAQEQKDNDRDKKQVKEHGGSQAGDPGEE